MGAHETSMYQYYSPKFSPAEWKQNLTAGDIQGAMIEFGNDYNSSKNI